jgi:segregation and condensation protein B
MSDKKPENPTPQDADMLTLVTDPFGLSPAPSEEEQDEFDEDSASENPMGDLSDTDEISDEELDEEDSLDELDEDDAAEMSGESLEEEALEGDETEELEGDAIEEAEPETVAYDLAGLARAMRAEEARFEEELLEVTSDAVAELKAETEELLNRQIAEDLALQKADAEAAEAELEVDPELAAALPGMPRIDESGLLDLSELQSCIETLLFMNDKPMKTERLQELLGPEIPFTLFQEAITLLKDRYQSLHHGIELVEIGGGFQLRTKPGRAALAKRLARVQTQRLSSGAMESLAIIAYKQPALKDDVDKIRGVDSSHFIRTLLDRKLITISGRSELPGRPMLYSTTQEFLELFGLSSLEEMPALSELEQMVPSSTGGKDDEDPRVREMRRLVGEMKANSQSILDYDPREDDRILKDIRERVQGISTSTPFLDEQKAQEKAEKEAKLATLKADQAQAEAALPQAELALEPTPSSEATLGKHIQTAPQDERISAD